MTRILVVDDDRSLLRALEIGLSARGYEIKSVQNAIEGLTQTSLFSPDIILLDLGLPDLNGIDFCRRVRSWSETPILVLSAAEDEQRKVEALDAGADDYVTKPFGMAELEARIRVALRHRKSLPKDGQNMILSVGTITIDLEKRQVTNHEKLVDLTAREFDLLVYLARNSGKVFTHQQILRDIWGMGYGNETHYLRVYINRLRKKLDDLNGELIKTSPGIGYQLLETSDS